MRAFDWKTQQGRIRTAAVAILALAWIYFAMCSSDERPNRKAAQNGSDAAIPSETTSAEARFSGSELRSALLGIARAARAPRSSTAPPEKRQSDSDPSPNPSTAPRAPEASRSSACGTSLSTYHEDSQFIATELPRRWGLNHGISQPGATLTSTKRGPVSNPGLCASGCAVLSLTIPAGSGWGGGAIVDEWFSGPTNLYGTTIVAKVALEVSRPSLPVNVRIFTQGAADSGYSWGTTASYGTSALADLSTFHEIVLHPVDRQGNDAFCASATGAIGIQVQRSRTTSVAIPVRLFIKSVVVGDVVANPAHETTKDDRDGGTGESARLHRSRTPRFDGDDGNCRLAESGAITVAADDWVAAGTCQSYGYTYTIGTRRDTKIVPTCNASRCSPRLTRVSSKAICASGTIAADPSWTSKAGLGFDFDPKRAKSTGLSVSYQMAGTAILRFMLDATNGTAYCADLDETDESGTTVTLPWESLTTRCWDKWNPGEPYVPTIAIKGVRLSATCLAAKNAWFDMCLNGLALF